MAAGRAWARGDTGQGADPLADARRSAAAFGIELVVEGEIALPGLWEELIPAWHGWCAVSGQWRVVSLSAMNGAKLVWLGLDYTAAQSGLQLAGVSVTPELWDDIRSIEAGAVEELNRG